MLTATQIKINNDGLIETVGTDLNVDLKVSPKGQGNFTIIGGADQDFNILDAAVELRYLKLILLLVTLHSQAILMQPFTCKR